MHFVCIRHLKAIASKRTPILWHEMQRLLGHASTLQRCGHSLYSFERVAMAVLSPWLGCVAYQHEP